MSGKYKVKNYGIYYCEQDGTETNIDVCSREENAQKICDILNADLENKVYNKSCKTCTNRFICPTFKGDECCDGYNDEQVFNGLLKMLFGGMANEHIDSMLEKCKIIQGRKKK